MNKRSPSRHAISYVTRNGLRGRPGLVINTYFPQMLYYSQYISGLFNTPYGKQHTSGNEAYVHPNMFWYYQKMTLKHVSRTCCVCIPYTVSWILVILHRRACITTLRRLCFYRTQGSVRSFYRWGYEWLLLSPKVNAKQHRWRENSHVFQVDQ